MAEQYRQIFFTQTLKPEKRLSHPIFEWRQYHMDIYQRLCAICDYVRFTSEMHADRHLHFHAILKIHKSNLRRFYALCKRFENEYGFNTKPEVGDYFEVQSYVSKFASHMSEYLGTSLPMVYCLPNLYN